MSDIERGLSLFFKNSVQGVGGQRKATIVNKMNMLQKIEKSLA
jgi:hypothetical protein